MSNRNFDSAVIIQRLQQKNYARNLYINNTTGQCIISNPQNSDGNASQFVNFVPGAQTDYFRTLQGSTEVDRGGISNIPPYPSTPTIVPSRTEPGSMLFNSSFGENGAYVEYPNNGDFAIGTADFTIEWFQYWTDGGGGFPRLFSIGSYDNEDISIAVSYEGTFILWVGPTPNFLGDQPPKNSWVHVAIVGQGGSTITVYINGVAHATIENSYDITDESTNLCIGNESIPNSFATYNGNITNFRWVNGTAVYTSDFTPPTAPLTAIPGTALLLLASTMTTVLTDSSTNAKEASNTDVTYSVMSPFA